MRRSVLSGLAAAVLLAAGAAVAADDLRWELGFSHDTPAWARMDKAAGKTEIAWFMTYTVENKSGAVRKPTLRAEIHTDTDKVYADSVNPLIIAAAKKKLGMDAKKEVSTALDLRKGIADGAKVSAMATFGAIDDLAQELELRVYGLEDPITKVKGKTIHEIRYWSVKYVRRGDEFGRAADPWKIRSEEWVVASSEELPDVQK